MKSCNNCEHYVYDRQSGFCLCTQNENGNGYIRDAEHHTCNKYKGKYEATGSGTITRPKIIDELMLKGAAKRTREKVERWLLEIIHNNYDNDFGKWCEELIGRLDGFEVFFREELQKEWENLQREKETE